MAEVSLTIAGSTHVLACRDGDEPRLLALGALLDAKAQRARSAAPSASDARIMLMAALLLADEMQEAATTSAPPADAALDSLADRIEQIAIRLEKLAGEA